MSAKQDYQDGLDLTCEMVSRWMFLLKERPSFAMPPADVLFCASIADVGLELSRNDGARELVRLLMVTCDRCKFSDYPTVTMLRVALEEADIPILFTPVEELGLTGFHQVFDELPS